MGHLALPPLSGLAVAELARKNPLPYCFRDAGTQKSGLTAKSLKETLNLKP
jgi:hypothetical protein